MLTTKVNRLTDNVDRLSDNLEIVEDKLNKVEDKLDRLSHSHNNLSLTIENDFAPKLQILYENRVSVMKYDRKLAVVDEHAADISTLNGVVREHTVQIQALRNMTIIS